MRLIIVIILTCCVFLSAREYSLEEKYAQLFMLGFQGTTGAEQRQFAQGVPWGGYILYSRIENGVTRNLDTPEQTRQLITEIKGDAKDIRIKPFIAADNEGGMMQIAQTNAGPFRYFAAPRTVTADYEAWAGGLADQLQSLGFTLNLAPVVDVDRGYTNPRAFSDTPNIVVERARLFIRAQQKRRIPATLKHFPGRTNGYPLTISNNWQAETDLLPFRELSNDADVVMASIMVFPAFGTTQSAVLVPQVYAALRNDCRFWGVALTDDLSLVVPPTLTEQELDDKITELILAGNDMLLFANNNQYDPDLATRLAAAIKRLIAGKRISEQRIEESFQRILALKKKYGIEPNEIYMNYQL